MKQHIFTGSGVAIITPMNADGTVNLSKYRELIEEQIQKGTDAIIAVGTTGEASTLADEEHLEALRTAVDQAAHRVPVIAGTGSNDTAHCIKMSLEAKAMGVDGLLLVTPYYNKTSQKGLYLHYTAIADAVDLPIILYNVPSRTGVEIKPETVVKLSKHKNIVAIKDATGNLSSIAKIAAHCDIDIYSGNDDQIVPILSIGGIGVISVLANILPRETHEICQKFFDGDVKGSCEMQLKYLDLINALFSDVNPIPIKEAMNLCGREVGNCRLPLCTMEDAAHDKLADILKHYGLL